MTSWVNNDPENIGIWFDINKCIPTVCPVIGLTKNGKYMVLGDAHWFVGIDSRTWHTEKYQLTHWMFLPELKK
jgi:hypothetical protein